MLKLEKRLMVVNENAGAVARLLTEGEELIGVLANELLEMKRARDVLEESSVNSVQLLEGVRGFLDSLAQLTGVVGAVAQELESSSLAALSHGLERRISANGVSVRAAIAAGNEAVLAELKKLREEVDGVRVLANKAAEKKGLVF